MLQILLPVKADFQRGTTSRKDTQKEGSQRSAGTGPLEAYILSTLPETEMNVFSRVGD
jgi:hypothetical protein